jgi:hypothetical protein
MLSVASVPVQPELERGVALFSGTDATTGRRFDKYRESVVATKGHDVECFTVAEANLCDADQSGNYTPGRASGQPDRRRNIVRRPDRHRKVAGRVVAAERAT